MLLRASYLDYREILAEIWVSPPNSVVPLPLRFYLDGVSKDSCQKKVAITSHISAPLYVVKRLLPATINQDLVYLVLDITIWGDPYYLWISLRSKMVPPITRSFKPQVSANSLYSCSSYHSHFSQWSYPFLRWRVLLWRSDLKSLAEHYLRAHYLLLCAAIGKICPLSPPQHHWLGRSVV